MKNLDVKIEILEKKLDSCEFSTSSCVEEIKTVDLDSSKQTTLFVKCFECDQCEHKDDDEPSLKQHMKQHHEVKCDKCIEIFHVLRKLNNYMCRVQLKDPEYLHLYMKNTSAKL